MAYKINTKLYDWQQRAKKEKMTCSKCGLVSHLTVDHIIPIQVLEMLDETGVAKFEWEENFQYLCRVCNAFKSCRLDKRNEKTKTLLLRLLTKNE
jgi:5-methylcytosine-specific restriction endonuclease McrA